jgi:nicotinamidase-related amidase
MIDQFLPQKGEVVIDKPGNDAFYATDLEQILRARNIRQLLLMGVTPDVCVSSTLRSANDRGFDSLVIRDACGAASEHLHQAVFDTMEYAGRIFGAYAESEVVLKHLSGCVNRNESIGSV